MHPFIWLYHNTSPQEYQTLIELEQINDARCPFVAAVLASDDRAGLTRAAVAYRGSDAWLAVPDGKHVGERWLDGLRQLINKPKQLGRVRRQADAWGVIDR